MIDILLKYPKKKEEVVIIFLLMHSMKKAYLRSMLSETFPIFDKQIQWQLAGHLFSSSKTFRLKGIVHSKKLFTDPSCRSKTTYRIQVNVEECTGHFPPHDVSE